MPSIEVTPAGNQLYEVELRDTQGASHHTVSVDDRLVDTLATDDVSMQDVVIASMEFLTGREAREELDREIDLAAIAERYDGFTEQVPARAQVLADQETAPPVDDDGAEGEPTGDDRLLAEVKSEQERGEVDQGQRRL
jgi:hypothetical protein